MSVLVVFALLVLFDREILQNPDSVTVYLNQSAVFNCETRGGTSSWKVNGISINNLPSGIDDDFTDSLTKTENKSVLTLTVQAKEQYNETIIQCGIVWYGGSVNSTNSTLLIQGPLSAVTDLGVISNASSVTISWSAPFSLDVTGVDPDIWYSVLLYNVTDENNPKLLEKHTTTTSYTFAPAGFSPCHKYLFSVIALNGAGRGETSRNITTGTQHCDLSTVIYPSSTVKRPETTVPTGGGALSPKDSKSPAGLDIGLAIGLPIGAVVVVVAAVLVGFYLKRKPKHSEVSVPMSDSEANQHKEEEPEAEQVLMEETPQTTQKHTATTQSSQPKHKKENVDDEKRHLLSNSVSASADTRGSLALSSTAKFPTRYQLQGRGNAPNSDMPSVTHDKGVLESEEQEKEATHVVGTSSGVQPPIPLDSIVQYAEIDIRATQKMLRPTPSRDDSDAKDATIKPGGRDTDVGKGASNKGGFEQTPEESTHSQDDGPTFVGNVTPSQKTDGQDNSTRGSKVTISNEHRDSAESDAPPLVNDFPSESYYSEDSSSDVYEGNTYDYVETEEETENHGLFSSVKCTEEQSKCAKLAMGDKDHDVSALRIAGRSPTFPPRSRLIDPAILTGGDEKALELSEPTPTDGAQVTEGERKALKPRQKTRGPSTSRKSNRKKRKKRGSLSPPANKRGPGHECETHDHSHPRTKTRKSCGNLPQD